MFLKLHGYLTSFDLHIWFTLTDGFGGQGIHWAVKYLFFLRILGIERYLDDIDYCEQMETETVRFYFKSFSTDVVRIYDSVYLNRRPDATDLDVLNHSKLVFNVCVGAVDCMKLQWNNCPFSVKGKYHSTKEVYLATVQVETGADHDLYVWHWFSGLCVTNNYMTMVAMSPLFRDILSGKYKLTYILLTLQGRQGHCGTFRTSWWI